MPSPESLLPIEPEEQEYSKSSEIERPYGKYHHRLEQVAKRVAYINKHRNQENFSTQNLAERDRLLAMATQDFFEARSDPKQRNAEQFQALKHIAIEVLGPEMGTEWFIRTAEKEVVLRTLEEAGYTITYPTAEEMSRYGLDARIDLTNNEFDALNDYGGSVLLAVQHNIPYVEVPDNQIVFTTQNESQSQLLGWDNLDFDKRNLAARNQDKQQFLDRYHRDNNRLWHNLGLIAEDEERQRVTTGDVRPNGIATILLPDTTGNTYTSNTNFIDWETGEPMGFLHQALIDNFDRDDIMRPSEPQRIAA